MPIEGQEKSIEAGFSCGSLRLASIVGGICLGLSYPPYGFSVLAWVALVPLFLCVKSCDSRSAFSSAWLFYVACFLVAFYWPMTHVRTDTAVISGLAWVAFTMLLAVPIGLSRRFVDRFPTLSGPWLAGAMIILLELVLRIGPVQMPWVTLANTQSSLSAIVSVTSVVGSEGVLVAIVLTNVLIASSIRTRSFRRFVTGIAGALIPFVLVALGTVNQVGDPVGRLRVAFLQPGISATSWSDVHDEHRVDSLLMYSTEMLDSLDQLPDLLIWPETALPVTRLDSSGSYLSMLKNWTAKRSVALLSGIIFEVPAESGEKVVYENGAILIVPDGSIQQVSKNHLVPFAEYVPFSNLLTSLNFLAVPAGGVSGYSPSKDPSVLTFRDTALGVMICFESSFSNYGSALTAAGSQIIVVMTQNGWWRGVAASEQHVQIARFRAVEQGRTIVQVSVDGTSGIVGPDGSVFLQMERSVRQGLVYDAPLYDTETVYYRIGSTLFSLSLGIWILLVGLYGFAKSRNVTLPSV